MRASKRPWNPLLQSPGIAQAPSSWLFLVHQMADHDVALSQSSRPSINIASLNSLTDGNMPTPLSSSRSSSGASEHPPASQVLSALAKADEYFEDAAYLTSLAGYRENVAPKLQHLLLAYLNGAFQIMGIDLDRLAAGDALPPLSYLPRHENVVARFLAILVKAGGLSKEGDAYVRSTGAIPSATSSQPVLQEILASHPAFAVDARMLELTGPQLGDCLVGRVDPLSLMFKTKTSSKVLADFYLHSPVFSTLTEHMISFLSTLLTNTDHWKEGRPIRICEVGAGLGGTTSRLIEFFQAMDVPVEYTFTDISPTLVKNASIKFAEHLGWMTFLPFDMEKPVTEALKDKFDMVIGTMVVHATSDRIASCSRLHELLVEGGFLMLSEGTEVVDWYDATFGLLEGWWLSGDYALQPEDVWMSTFSQAGFAQCGFSKSPMPESKLQRLLVGVKGNPV